MNLQTFTSFSGRIPRKTFWLAALVLMIAIWIMFMVLGLIFGVPMAPPPTDGSFEVGFEVTGVKAIPFIIGYLIMLWPSLALYTKRWHDRDKSGWWSLILFVPFIGGIWMLIECGFLRGTEGANRFGPDPIAD
jgi:uncharacterized membrane protein YhaH (DUF805 family)